MVKAIVTSIELTCRNIDEISYYTICMIAIVLVLSSHIKKLDLFSLEFTAKTDSGTNIHLHVMFTYVYTRIIHCSVASL